MYVEKRDGRERWNKMKADPEAHEKHKATARRYYQRVLSKKADYMREKARATDERRTATPEARKAHSRSVNCRRRKVRNTKYQPLAAVQNHLCAICNQSETVMRNGKLQELAIDHDHETGEIRGLLCFQCNTGIGKLGDDESRIWSAYNYLVNHRRKRLRLVS